MPCCFSSTGSSFWWYSRLALSKWMAMSWLNASSPWATTSNRSPTGTTSPNFSVSRWSTRSCIITFRAVRSRWSTLDTAISVCTRAGLNG